MPDRHQSKLRATLAAVANQERDDDGLTSRETGRILGVSPMTLKIWRVRGEGPPFFRIGNTRTVRYVRADVLAYRNAAIVGKKVAP